MDCLLQVKCPTMVQGCLFDVIYHVLPDDCLNEEVLLGRDILEQGISVKINSDSLIFSKTKSFNACSRVEKTFDMASVDTDLVGKHKEQLIEILKKHSPNFIQKLPTSRVSTGELKIQLNDANKTVHRRPYL